MLLKNTFRLIKKSLARYLAIFAIIALGVGFFAGLRITATSILVTADRYLDDLHLYDFRLLSTIGLQESDVEAFQQVNGISGAYGSVTMDAMITNGSDASRAFRFHTYDERINGVDVVKGRLPQAPNECVIDQGFTERDLIGTVVKIAPDNAESTLNAFTYTEYTVVGTVRSSYYINFERGTTSLSDGTLSGFIYIPKDGFQTDYYTEIYLTVPKVGRIYSDEYNAQIEALTDTLNELLKERADVRLQRIREDGQTELNQNLHQFNEKKNEYETNKVNMRKELDQAELQLNAFKQDVADKLDAYNKADPSLSPAELEALQTDCAVAYAKYNAAQTAFDTQKIQYNRYVTYGQQVLNEAQAKLDDAQHTLDTLPTPTTFVLDRSTNLGYASLDNDTHIVIGVSRVFPLFFFLVAALVCTTTMTRMVEELRTENGTLKSLGFSNFAIIHQYLIYSGSASVVGCIGGFLAGSKLFPVALWGVYRIMYQIERPIAFVADWKLFFLCSILFLICSLGATALVLLRTLREVPASLVRPKTQDAGKRIFLEKIPFIWNRMKFLHKVSARNILRYRKRLIMMIIGIGGCTALLITGIGIRDTIMPLVDRQFGEISLYDSTITFIHSPIESEKHALMDAGNGQIESISYLYNGSVDTVGHKTESVNLMVVEKGMPDLMDLHYNKEQVAWPGLGQAVINGRLAQSQGLKIGDTVTVRDSDLHELSFTVSGIFDNYVYDYVIVTQESVKAISTKDTSPNSAYLIFREGADVRTLSAHMQGLSCVAAVTLNADLAVRVNQLLQNLNYIVLIVLVSAGALAFIVLYNLTNISITERIREIATLKVLGFYHKETAMYVFRENLVLTLISSICGIPMGWALLTYVMSQIKIKSIYFGCRFLPTTCLIAVAITFVFAVVAEFFLLGKLKKINMAESLKSIE